MAGAFDIDAQRGREFGVNIGVEASRCYDSWPQMFADEASRSDGIEVVTIATPNGAHYEISKAALSEGLTEAWSNIYLKFALAIEAKQRGDEAALANMIYPDIDAGIEGVRWVENCVRSADKGAVWVNYE